MAIFIALLVAAVCVALVATPFLNKRKKGQVLETVPVGEDAQENRRRIYHEMDTVQLDYDMGNIDKAQYQEQMQSYKLEAASLIRDQQEKDGYNRDKAVEEEIKTFRSVRRSGQPLDTCPNCGFITSHAERVCPLCGQSLETDPGTKDKKQ